MPASRPGGWDCGPAAVRRRVAATPGTWYNTGYSGWLLLPPDGSRRMAEVEYALSLKQPWAALLVHGVKTIEVRRWPTARRGRVLIHAARVPDDRPEAWSRVPEELHD